MTKTYDRPAAHQIYSNYLYSQSRESLATELWGYIPHTLGKGAKILSNTRMHFDDSPNLEILASQMKANMRKMGILTSKTSDAIDKMHLGVVETGQQPMFMGGPSLILNKIAYIASLAKEANMIPLFYVADYDGVQPELTNMRLPSPSSKGLHLSYPILSDEENLAIYEVDLPDEDWFRKILDKIESNYRGILKNVDISRRDVLQQNLSQAYTLIKSAYYSTENVSTFSTKILGMLLNLEADLGIPVYWFSMPETRPLFIDGYELLLQEPNRTRFIEATNIAAEKVESAGFSSQIGKRSSDYVPFFLECMNPDCRRIRIELKYKRKNGSDISTVNGKCPVCQEKYSFSFDSTSPDLSEIVEWITPRVDSRQIIVNTVIPIVAHIGGPGETSYYAEVIPAANSLELPFPTFMRYTRTFYNTPWNELTASRLKKQGVPIITSDDLFKNLSNWVKARNNENAEELWKAHIGIEKSINSTFTSLQKLLSNLGDEIAEIKEKLRMPGDRRLLIEDMKNKQAESQMIDKYLSWAFGRFSPEKFGQEVNWLWLDLGIATGISDLMGVFLRQYNMNTPNSSVFFVNIT